MKKLIPLLIGLMFLIPIAALSLPSAQAAPTVYFSSNFDDGGMDGWVVLSGTGVSVTNTEHHSSPNSLFIYTDDVIQTNYFFQTPEPFTASMYIYPISYPTGGNYSNYFLQAVNGTNGHTALELILSSAGHVLIMSLNPLHTDYIWNDTGFVIPLNSWSSISANVHGNYCDLTVNGVTTTDNWCNSYADPATYLTIRTDSTQSMYIDDILVSNVFVSNIPRIISVPITSAISGMVYSYNAQANQQGGTWTIDKPSWLSAGSLINTNHVLIQGTAPQGNFSLKLVYHNVNGTAYQNFSINVAVLNPHFTLVDLFAVKPGQQNYSVLVSWVNTASGQMIAPAGTYIDQVYVQFQPSYPYPVSLQMNLAIYDNHTLIYQGKFNQTATDGNPSTVYSYYTGLFNNNIKLTTVSGHFYYFTLDAKISNASGPLPSQGFSGTVTTSIPATVQQNWIGGILWILILFTGPWIMNWFFPRYGFLLGMVLMAVLLSISTPSFIYVGLIIVLVIAIEGYAFSRSGV